MTQNWGLARKKPIIIQFREVESITTFKGQKGEYVQTHEGELFAFVGQDFIIKGVKGELYPIKKSIFHETYDVVKEVS
jgi:hypothetical protein